ncbi:MAG: peptidase M23 [Acidimicrobiales bacterium]
MSDISAATSGATQLEKATLTIIPASSNPRSGEGKTLKFQFNPKEYTVTKSATWSRTDAQAAKEAGPVQWQGAGPKSMRIEIYLDESASGSASVLKDTDLLFTCCTPTKESLSSEKPSGPFVLFGWGNQMSFTAVVKSVSIAFLMFRPNGDPYRAKATLEMEQVDVPASAQNPTSGALASRRTHVMVDGETLAHVAHSEYRDAGVWRILAEANGIDDPFRVAAGTRVLVPAPGEPAAGEPAPAAAGSRTDDGAARDLAQRAG